MGKRVRGKWRSRTSKDLKCSASRVYNLNYNNHYDLQIFAVRYLPTLRINATTMSKKTVQTKLPTKHIMCHPNNQAFSFTVLQTSTIFLWNFIIFENFEVPFILMASNIPKIIRFLEKTKVLGKWGRQIGGSCSSPFKKTSLLKPSVIPMPRWVYNDNMSREKIKTNVTFHDNWLASDEILTMANYKHYRKIEYSHIGYPFRKQGFV